MFVVNQLVVLLFIFFECQAQIVPPKPIKLVHLQGWRAVGTHEQSMMWVDTTRTFEDCMEKCRQSWDCRLATYNINERKCWGIGFRGDVRFIRDVSFFIAADSYKVFVKKNNTDYPGGDILSQGQRVADDTWDEGICLTLCHIHPLCNAISYNKIIGWCRLKQKTTLEMTVSSSYTSYIS